VSDAFDPYLNWLGVPPEERPANCYRLLGLQVFESNPVSIDHAADERMTYLKQLLPGPQGALAQKVLKEVWSARALLLDPQKKAAYDAQLRRKLGPPPAPAPRRPAQAPAPMPSGKSRVVRRKRSSVLPLVLRLVGLALVGFAATLLWKHFNPPMGTVKVQVAVDERMGMELEIDGKPALLPEGEEEISYRFPPGKYEFVLKRPRYEPCVEQVDLKDGETRTVIARWKHYPRLVLQFPMPDRRDAVVKIDGKQQTPDRVTMSDPDLPITLPAGTYQLRVERPGFVAFEQKIVLPAGEDVKVQPTWQAERQVAGTQKWGDSKASWGGLQAFQPASGSVVSPFKADPNAPPEKQSEPNAADQAAARKRLDEKFAADKVNSAAEKLAMAKKLAAAGVEPQSDLADSYMLFRVAAQLFLEAGDLKASMQAVDKLATAFLIDDLAWRSAAIKQYIAGEAEEAKAATAVEQSTVVFDRYLAERQYEPATELADKLLDYCQRAKAREGRKQIADRQTEIKRREAVWKQYTQAVERLKEKPDDAQANQIVGLWRCLVENEMQRGLKNLGNSGDSRLQAISKEELLVPNTPADQAKLGGMWYDLSSRFQDDFRLGMRKRAGFWYQKAYSRLPAGITKITIEKRLTELGMSSTGADSVASTTELGKPAAKPGPKLPTGPVVTTDNGPLDGRVGELKDQLVAVYGSDAEMQTAVEGGLKWLAEHQYPDGSWSFSHVLSPRCSGKCPNPGELYKCRNAATALALLAFLGAGNTHESGPYALSVTGGLTYLVNKMKLTGGSLYEQEVKYGHAAATTALAELYAMTGDKRLLPVAQQAVLFLCSCQQPNGAWRYDPRAPEADTALNSWQVQALRAAHMARLAVPPQIMKNTIRYFENVKAVAEETTVLRAATGDKDASAGTLLSRIYMGWKKEDISKGSSQLARLGWADFDFEFDLLATPVMFQMGGLEWTVWSKAMRQSLMRTQATEGHAKGSWAIVDDPKFVPTGRHFSTCVALLCLEVYYRYLPVYREAGEKTAKKRAQDPEVQWRPLITAGPGKR
jgi:hypothetical protein